MAFTPEDGTGLAGANSYTDIEFADEFHDLRGNAAWTGATGPQKEAALVKATDYIDQKYEFLGQPAHETQALAWPRIVDRIDHGVPAKIKQATAQLALEALSAELNPNSPAAGQVKRVRIEGAVEKEFFETRNGTIVRRAIDGLLRGLTARAGWNVPVVRV